MTGIPRRRSPSPIVDTARAHAQNPHGMPRGNQLSRQWRLLQRIGRPAGVTVEDAARELECSVRTIWRDISVLENAGFPPVAQPANETEGIGRW